MLSRCTALDVNLTFLFCYLPRSLRSCKRIVSGFPVDPSIFTIDGIDLLVLCLLHEKKSPVTITPI